MTWSNDQIEKFLYLKYSNSILQVYHKTMLFYSTNFRGREGLIDMVKTLFWGQRAYTGAFPVLEIAALKTMLPKLENNHQQKTLSKINANYVLTSMMMC